MKQHRNDRWDRCTASAGDWLIIMTASHRSANQRYFMHNSATVHSMRMQSMALDSSRSQLCNDTSTGVVRHQITKRQRLQKVVSYDVLHHSCGVNHGLPPWFSMHFKSKATFLAKSAKEKKVRSVDERWHLRSANSASITSQSHWPCSGDLGVWVRACNV